MGNETRLWKWVLVLVLVVGALYTLNPPGDRLKPGIDLAGGTSLIYAIDTTGMTDDDMNGLSERVMNILKTRVDPNSQFNLVWRPLGNNRLEIQMPRPPVEAAERRAVYESARDELRGKNVRRVEIEDALHTDNRTEALAALERGVAERTEPLKAVAAAYAEYDKLRGGDDLVAEDDALMAYEEALEAVLATNLPLGRLTDVLALKPAVQQKELASLINDFPSYKKDVEDVKVAYDGWADQRGSLEDPADLKRLLRGAGVLEFRILAERENTQSMMLSATDTALRLDASQFVDQLAKRGPRPRSGDRYAWFPIEDPVKFMQCKRQAELDQRLQNTKLVVSKYAGKYYVLAHSDADYGLTKSQKAKWTLKRAIPIRDYQTGKPAVSFTLDAPGGQQFAKLTKNNIGHQLAIFLDGTAASHATIQSQIIEHGQITGDFTQERVGEIVRRLEAGSLPARLKETPLLEKTTGPSLGLRNREMGMNAAIYGLGAVVVFMLVYYLITGVLADIALIMNLLFVLAIMAVMEATFTLPGIAGLLLTVGMAVDANVLIYERIREELARGVVLRKAVKIGYDKAFSTIVDANLTTLITCVILGYVASEEVKGFAMTLGFGVVTSMFTALFVTRMILALLIEKGIVKSLPMLHLIRRPSVNWIALRRLFWPVSVITVCGGLAFFVVTAVTDKEAVFDIEFLGGTSVQIELAKGQSMTDEDVRGVITGSNGDSANSVTAWLTSAAEAMRSAKVEEGSVGGEFQITSDKLSPAEVNVCLRTKFEASLTLGGFQAEGNTAVFETKARTEEIKGDDGETSKIEHVLTLEEFKAGVEASAEYVAAAATRLEGARIQTVSDVGQEEEDIHEYEIVTVEYSKELVRAAVLAVMGEKLNVEQPIKFEVHTDAQLAPDGLFPIREDHEYLHQVIGGEYATDVRAYKGGVALVFDKLNPPQTIHSIDRRIKEMRLQPQFEQYEWRDYSIYGLERVEGQEVAAAGGDSDQADVKYGKVALLVVDDNVLYSDSPEQWRERLANPELEQATEALSAEKSLRKVVQFAPQIASQTQQQAMQAMLLALLAIVAYVWIRFGTMQYGFAAIVALVHDVGITLGLIAIADEFGLGDFRINLAMIAALLTIVGYSLNDTIVVFDRIRETRGKLTSLSDNIINSSINMTLSRTLLTSITTFLAVVCLFIWGGPGVHGFSFALLVGVIVGSYSSIGIAAPLLQSPRLLRGIIYVLVAGSIVAMVATGSTTDEGVNVVLVSVVAIIMAIITAVMFVIDRRMESAATA